MNKQIWVIMFYFDDDPNYCSSFDKVFKTKKGAVNFVERNLGLFFPFVEKPYEKVKKMEIGRNVRWRYGSERVELKPQSFH